MDKNERDPRIDPCDGDVIYKKLSPGVVRYRQVSERDGGTVRYVDGIGNDGGVPRCCWISTWISWAQSAEIKNI